MSGFYIDIHDSTGAKQGVTSYDVSNVRLSEKANRIGQLQFTLPALDANTIGAAFGVRYRLYSERNGYLGEYRHKQVVYDADARTATITADDSLLDLANQIVGFNRAYSNATVKSIIEALAALSSPTPWTVAYETGIEGVYNRERVSLEFQGESILTALDFVRAYMRGWFRRSGDTQITFGRFRDLGFQNTYYANSPRVQTDGTVLNVATKYADATWLFKYNGNQATVSPSEVDAWLTNVAVASDAVARSTQYTTTAGALAGTPSPYATITRLQKTVDGNAVVNRVIPRGAGQGITSMDLRYSTFSGSPYTIQSALNADGSRHYYIEDAASIAAYGRVTRVLPFSEVRPITNSAADLQNAANALYVLGTAYMRKFKQPYEVFNIQVVNLPEAAEVGSVVVVDFRGVALMPTGEAAYLHIDAQPFFIIEKTTSWGESGEAVYDLVISSNGEGNVSTTDIFVNTLRDIEKFKARPEPTIAYYMNANPTLPIQAGGGGDPTVSVEFPFVLDAGVLLINNMTLEMQLDRFTTFGISELVADAFTVGLPPAGEETTEGGDLLTSGASTRTTSDFNSPQGSTSQDGGGSSPTTFASPHAHRLQAAAFGSGSYSNVFWDTYGNSFYIPGLSGDALTFTETPNHTHLVNIPSHQHSFSLPVHQHGMDHTHAMDPHTHRHQHRHALDQGILTPSFGVFQAPTLPENVTVLFNGTPVTGWTVVQDNGSATTTGALCSGAGLFRADLTNYFPPAGQNHEGTYSITIGCGQYGGLVFCRLLGRVTIQPIAV